MKISKFMGTVFLTSALLLALFTFSCGGKAQEKTNEPQSKARPKLKPAAPGGHVYYVAKTGSDKNPGTAEQPWLTIQHAVEKMTTGDKVHIRTGTYNESVHIKKNGSSDAPIVIAAYPGEMPVIDGSGVKDWNNSIIMENSSYIQLNGLEIRKWNDNGVEISDSNHLKIFECVVHDVGGGIQLIDGSHDFEFNRVETHHFEMFAFDASPGEGGAPCYNGTFAACAVHTGRNHDQNVDGFALGHGKQHDFKLNRCQVYDVFDGFDMSARKLTLTACSVHDCWNAGFKLWQDEQTLVNCLSYHNEVANVIRPYNGVPGTATLQNCTFFDAGTFNISIESTRNSLRMYNCILAGGKNIGLAFEKKLAKNYGGDYNVFHNNNSDRLITVGYDKEFSLNQIDDWRSYSGHDENSVVVRSTNQIFINPKEFDLHLKDTSPAVDKGRSNGAPERDHDDRLRPQGKTCDIGAYEMAMPVDKER